MAQEKSNIVKVFFPELGISCDVDATKMQKARDNDRRGYATFNGVDSEGEELFLDGSEGNEVLFQILMNDTTVKSKGKSKTKRKSLSGK